LYAVVQPRLDAGPTSTPIYGALLEEANASQTKLDQRRVQLHAERQHVVDSARAEADQLQEQALATASAQRAEARAEAEASRLGVRKWS
jgi:hypothetical protein